MVSAAAPFPPRRWHGQRDADVRLIKVTGTEGAGHVSGRLSAALEAPLHGHAALEADSVAVTKEPGRRLLNCRHTGSVSTGRDGRDAIPNPYNRIPTSRASRATKNP